MNSSPHSVDVVIVGGGLVGCSLAVALTRVGRRVVLVEAQPACAEAASWDERCIALNAGSRQILESLGLWDALRASAEPITSTHISERGRFGAARFTAEQAGVPALGYNTPLRAINQALWDRCAADGIDIRRPARLASLDVLAHAVALRLHTPEGEQALHARLLVAADGARSAVREHLGLAAHTHDYAQSAIVTAIRPQHPHQGVAYERFLPSGPLAVLPKPDDAEGHACSLVWTVPSDQVATFEGWDDATFLAQAMRQFGERLGRFHALGRRQSYPLARVMSAQLCAARTVLVGNAAQSLHPVAAQGFNLGLRDAATLAALLEGQDDAGASALLDQYRHAREDDRQRVSNFTDGLVRLFSNRVPGLHRLRHLGLLALELDSPVRDAVLRQNLGFGDRAGARLP